MENEILPYENEIANVEEEIYKEVASLSEESNASLTKKQIAEISKIDISEITEHALNLLDQKDMTKEELSEALQLNFLKTCKSRLLKKALLAARKLRDEK